MPYVITAPCVADFSCQEVCPADCIHPLSGSQEFMEVEQLYIDPRKCINCRACVDVCPVQAIFEDTLLPPQWSHYAAINRDFFLDRDWESATV